jgi:hypothetical protein
LYQEGIEEINLAQGISSVTVASHTRRDEKHLSVYSSYPLQSSSQSSLLLRSLLRTPRRRSCINLVSVTEDASTSMSDVEHDPEALTDSEKLDQLLGLVATMNTWLECQSKQLTMVEAAIPLLAQACGVVLSTGYGGVAGSTPSTGMDAGSGTNGTPTAGDVSDPGDELATVGGEPAHTGGSGGMGPSCGDSFTVRGGGGRGAGGGIAGGRLGHECGWGGARKPEDLR